ncbi:MAG: SBBP repeat-containing protein [Phycisphaeraceae bacterium]|nr:SBBP repeat-containing protein [Phycisphaeraceae bacterium]
MRSRAMEGMCLGSLVKMAIPLCRRAQQQCPRTGPGKPPDFDHWQMAVLMMVAIHKKRKSKSAQYRYLHQHRDELTRLLGLPRFPVRSTYFQRYGQGHRLFRVAIELQGQKAVEEGAADARVVAVDKSLSEARGPKWQRKDRKRKRIPRKLHGVDSDCDWGYSPYHGWVQGYSYEVLVTASQRSNPVFSLWASAATAGVREHVSFADNLFITGETRGSLGGPNAGSNDAFVSRYDSSGNVAWTHQFGTSSYDYNNGVATDAAGNLFITGYTFGSLGGPNAGASDAFLVKFASITALGDANDDQQINLTDLQILGDNWQASGANWAMGDFTGDGLVNLADLQVLGDNWGYGVGEDVSFDDALLALPGVGLNVPEPTALALLLLGCLAGGLARPARSKLRS